MRMLVGGASRDHVIASLVYIFVLRDDSILMESTLPSPASPRDRG